MESDSEVHPDWLGGDSNSDSGEKDSDSGLSDASSERSDHNTDTQQSEDDSEEELITNNKIKKSGFLLGKDGATEWTTTLPNQKKRRKKQDIVLRLPGVRKSARHAQSPMQCWKLFFPDSSIQKIVHFTNLRLKLMESSYTNNKSLVRPTNLNEIHALFGLLYLIGVKKGSHINAKELWATDGTSPDCYRAVFSQARFNLLLSILRFDNIVDREERKGKDNLAPIREFADDFISRCNEHYSPGAYVTIDEMLEGFKGKCKFRQYIPSKPAKYGIKIFALVDSRTFYTCNMEIYCGKQPEGPYQRSNAVYDIVMRVAAPILNAGRNITFDNYFTSVPLAMDLFNNCNTTIVGTMKINKREIPPVIVNVKNREICSSQFLFTENSTLVSYVPKKGKNVLLYSTYLNTNKIDDTTGSKKKPEILTFYNLTKGAVDVVDEMKGNYSVGRETHRWPMVILYSFLNIAGINSQIIWHNNTDIKISRREFLKRLSTELFHAHLLTRFNQSNLSTELKSIIQKVGKISTDTASKLKTTKEGYCHLCPRRKNRKSKIECLCCAKSMCRSQHTKFICEECFSKIPVAQE